MATAPILKARPIAPKILSISPRPPAVQRELPLDIVAQSPPKSAINGGGKSLRETIDYDKLTPTQQAKWDRGIYGSIQLKNTNNHQYYVCRWYEPGTKIRRSTYLGLSWDIAIAKLKLLTCGYEK